MFGLQFYGECWSGSNRPPFGSDSYRESKKCISFQYEKCQNNDPNECVGEAMTNYVYRIMEGKKKIKTKITVMFLCMRVDRIFVVKNRQMLKNPFQQPCPFVSTFKHGPVVLRHAVQNYRPIKEI